MGPISTNVRFELSQTVTEHFKAFTNFLDHQIHKYNDRPLIRYYSSDNDIPEYKILTYSQVDRIVTNLACEWYQHTKDVEVVGLIAAHSVSYFIYQLVLFKLRVTALCISPRNSEAAIINLLEKTNCKLVITTEVLEENIRSTVNKVPGVSIFVAPNLDLEVLSKAPLNPNASNIIDTNFSDDDVSKTALILHSSGSTSLPKPIYLSNRYMFNMCRVLQVRINSHEYPLGLNENDNFLCATPLFHIIGVFIVFGAVIFGGSTVFLDKLPTSAEKIMFALSHNKCSITCFTPYFLDQIMNYMNETKNYSAASSLKYIISSGAPLKYETGQWFHDHGINVRILYGMTEIAPCMVADMNPDNKIWNSVAPSDFDPNGEPYLQFETFNPAEPKIKHLYIRGDAPFLASNICNRPDGGFDTSDLFIEDTSNPGHYLHYGRKDDILILKNGEKTNPIPMETTISQFPIVDQVAVIGNGRHCTAALITLNTDYAFDFSPQEMIEAVHEAVKEANRDCPKFSTIVPQMVKILPLSKKLPATDKGSVKRKMAEIEYKDIVERLYKDFLEGPERADNNIHDTSAWTLEQTKTYLAESVASILNLSVSTFSDGTKSLFDFGLDSLTSIQLRNKISGHFKNIAQNFIFQYATIDSMAKALMSQSSPNITDQVEQRYQQTQELAEEYVKKANKDFGVSTNNYDETKPKVIFLTGATGSLGSFMLRDLLNDSSVKKVYCAVRGKQENLFDRLVEAFQSRFLDVNLLSDADRVEAIPMTFTEPYLGLGKEFYEQLKEEVTIVQHCAWLLDFNMPIDHFDKECIAPLYHLLKFAHKDINPMHVHFISSVSASSALGDEIEERPLPFDSHVAMPIGYSQSKFVVEMLFDYLCKEKNFPCYIERLGQVCGDSENGIWNTSEQYPLMFVGGGSIMHKMPALDTKIDWITVDHAASAIVNIMLHTSNSPANHDESIYHIVNPHTIHWSDVLNAMKASGITFDVVPATEWVQELSKDDSNPAFRLISYYEDIFQNSFKMSAWKTEKTVKSAPTLKNAPVLDASLFSKFLSHWQYVRFYDPSL